MKAHTLTEQDQVVLAAIDNESTALRCTLDSGDAERGAWDNASIYCDAAEIEITVIEFRAAITKLTGLNFNK